MSDRSSYINGEVSKLLAMYEQYKQLLDKQQSIATKLAKQRLLGGNSDQHEARYKELGLRLQAVSDATTFATPTIWMKYKNEAYREEMQPIETMHDFRMHCSNPGYICTKRFTFLNTQLKENDLPELSDENTFADDVLLEELILKDILAPLEMHAKFMQQWSHREYNKSQGRVAKWENFVA